MRDATEPAEFDVPIGARHLRVTRCGNGPVNVVFEAGGGCSGADWLPVQRLLPQVTSWSYDRAGEGASPGNGDWSLDASVRDLRGWLAAVDVTGPVVLVGHSLGCHIVRALAAEDPAAASAMLLVDARPPGFERTVLDAGIAIPMPPPGSSIFKEFTLADDLVSGLPAPAGVAAAAICCERFDGAPGQLSSTDTDVVAGLWREAQAGVARAIGQPSVLVAPGTGHRVPAEAPDFVASAIRDLLDGRPVTGSREERA
ncbi:alpha/beta fold hydrolase [Streptomyces sp. CA-111067]|uniref:alpha/beta fold hydrolase n=1 Tax=Streptomyces sp. CA-111067 TaxID=3240046 RepID=UPI003D983997